MVDQYDEIRSKVLTRQELLALLVQYLDIDTQMDNRKDWLTTLDKQLSGRPMVRDDMPSLQRELEEIQVQKTEGFNINSLKNQVFTFHQRQPSHLSNIFSIVFEVYLLFVQNSCNKSIINFSPDL